MSGSSGREYHAKGNRANRPETRTPILSVTRRTEPDGECVLRHGRLKAQSMPTRQHNSKRASGAEPRTTATYIVCGSVAGAAYSSGTGPNAALFYLAAAKGVSGASMAPALKKPGCPYVHFSGCGCAAASGVTSTGNSGLCGIVRLTRHFFWRYLCAVTLRG